MSYADLVIRQIKYKIDLVYSYKLVPSRVTIGIDAFEAIRSTIQRDWIDYSSEQQHMDTIFGLPITIDYDNKDLIQVNT